MSPINLLKEVIAEFVCTSILIIVGCGSCIEKTKWSSINSSILQISITFGLAVATLVRCIGHVSGGHINPAVTLAMLMMRRINWIRALLYILAQMMGAVAGSGFLKVVTPMASENESLCSTIIANEVSPFPAGVMVEALITFMLVFTILAAEGADKMDSGGTAPLCVGLCVMVCHMFATKYTGSSMNPARSFGPAVINGIWINHWVYWVGPISGGMMAVWVCQFILSPENIIHKMRNYFQRKLYPVINNGLNNLVLI